MNSPPIVSFFVSMNSTCFCYLNIETTHRTRVFFVRFAKVKHPRINSFSRNGFALALSRFRCVEFVTLESKLTSFIFIVSARARQLCRK